MFNKCSFEIIKTCLKIVIVYHLYNHFNIGTCYYILHAYMQLWKLKRHVRLRCVFQVLSVLACVLCLIDELRQVQYNAVEMRYVAQYLAPVVRFIAMVSWLPPSHPTLATMGLNIVFVKKNLTSLGLTIVDILSTQSLDHIQYFVLKRSGNCML